MNVATKTCVVLISESSDECLNKREYLTDCIYDEICSLISINGITKFIVFINTLISELAAEYIERQKLVYPFIRLECIHDAIGNHEIDYSMSARKVIEKADNYILCDQQRLSKIVGEECDYALIVGEASDRAHFDKICNPHIPNTYIYY